MRKELKKTLEDLILRNKEINEEEILELVEEYYFGDSINLEEIETKLLKIYQNHLEKEIERLGENTDIKINEITKIISAFSFANKEKLSDYPFERDLKIFPNVEEIILLYTVDIREKYEKVKKEIENNKKISVIGIEIEGSSAKKIYETLKKCITEFDISRKNTIFDITLGMKTFAMAFYRFSVERQIKFLNWNEKFFKKYIKINENEYEKLDETFRFELTSKLNVIEEPLEETITNYSIINNNIEKGNYGAVSGIYKILGMSDISYFYKILNEIFDIDKMAKMTSEEFFDNCLENIKKILNYSEYEKNTKIKLKLAVSYLFAIIYYIVDKKEQKKLEKNQFEISEKDIKKFTIDSVFEENDIDIIGIQKEKYFSFLKLKYCILSEKPDFYLDEIKYKMEKNKDLVGDSSKREDLIDKLELNDAETLEKIHEVIFGEEMNCEESIFTSFNLEETLKEENYKLKFENNILEIPHHKLPKYILKIDLEKDLKKIRRGFSKYTPIFELLDNLSHKRELKSDEVVKILSENSRSPITKIFRDLKEGIVQFNECIKNKMAHEKVEVGDFFKVSNIISDYSIYISEEFE